jgi:CubicO group peptidase (beta-lactamase class C family)
MSTRVSPDEPLIVVGALPLEPDVEYGGGGLFSTVEDYLKLLKSLLRNDGKLLKSESIDLLFKDALSPPTKTGLNMMLSNELWASICIPGEPQVGTAHGGNWTHSIGGLLGLDNEGGGHKGPWLSWGGAPNLHWFIDREAGACGIFGTQLSLPGERRHHLLVKAFEDEMIRKLGKGA